MTTGNIMGILHLEGTVAIGAYSMTLFISGLFIGLVFSKRVNLPVWRKCTIVGGLSLVGVVALWGVESFGSQVLSMVLQ